MIIKAKKSLGQNFLKDKNVLKKIADISLLDNTSELIEIGPGTGNLTDYLIKKNPKKIFLIEKDEKLSKYLENKFFDKIKVINKDILKFFDYKIFSKNTIVIGNLPYNISSQILVKFILDNNFNYKALIFMFQKEMADRILAKVNSKNYGRLSILSNWKFDIKKLFDIKPSSFEPKPKVESSLLFFSEKVDKYNLKNPKNLELITRVLFNQRRKKIRKSINNIFRKNNKIINDLNINLDLRPQNLDIQKPHSEENEAENNTVKTPNSLVFNLEDEELKSLETSCNGFLIYD